MNLPLLPRHILTPGPVQVPKSISDAFALPPIHHRTERFALIWKQLQSGLQYVCQTRYPALLIPGTGTAGMEMLMSNVLQTGDSVLVSVNGKFSSRWETYLQSLGIQVTACRKAWGETITPEDLEATALTCQPAAAVLTHCETSTGQVMDLEMAVYQLRKAFPEILILVDVNSTLGIIPFYMDAWGIDAISFASQKGLMCPAGLCGIVLSDRMQGRLAQNRMEDAMALHPYLKAGNEDSYPFTPPIQMLYALLSSVELLQAETLPVRWQGVHDRARRFRQALTNAGNRYTQPFPVTGDVLTVFAPNEISCKDLQKRWLEQDGIEIAGGQDAWNGNYLRVAHFGGDNAIALEALIQVL